MVKQFENKTNVVNQECQMQSDFNLQHGWYFVPMQDLNTE